MDTTTPSPDPNPPCPRCRATHVVRNGTLRSGSPELLCRACSRRFVAEPKKGPVSDERQDLARRLLLERLRLRAIARSRLQVFVNSPCREETPWEPGPLEKSRAG